MEMSSKYNIGQEVFYMEDNKVVSRIIGSIRFQATSRREDNVRPLDLLEVKTYGFRIMDGKGNFKRWEEKDEDALFGSKAELLASL